MIVWIGLHVVGIVLILGTIILFAIKEKIKKWFK